MTGGSLPERLRQRNAVSYVALEEPWVEEDEVLPAEKEQEVVAVEGEDTEVCEVCGEVGEVLLCDTCPRVYHLSCLDPPLTEVPEGSWSCDFCRFPFADMEKVVGVRRGRDKIGARGCKEYQIKWKGRSHMHCSWIPEPKLMVASRTIPGVKTKLHHFLYPRLALTHKEVVEEEEEEDQRTGVRQEWVTADRIIAARGRKEVREYLVKWCELGYEHATWEKAGDLDEFKEQLDRYHSAQRGKVEHTAEEKRKRTPPPFDTTPPFLTGGVLHPYQVQGLNWLRFAWHQRQHVILADEMGLGKTVQSIAFLDSVFREGGARGKAALVVAPLSTLRNWEREFATWSPDLNTVLYVGDKQGRAVIREHEFYLPLKPGGGSRQERIKFHVLLTSYETVITDCAHLKPILWESLIVDEGHRLKNRDSRLFLSLHPFHTTHRILLTGTPLQNNLNELFMLMHFLDAKKFGELSEFQAEFESLGEEEQVQRLHRMLAPHLLRRLKRDVLKDMPLKKEQIVRVELAAEQQQLYKDVLTRNYAALAHKGGKARNNVMMQLRKVCGHPWLMGVEGEERRGDLVGGSGKLALLDAMMVRLKEQGHRVLIYSQFTTMLTLLEEWVAGRGWRYERLDGSVAGSERQIRIDRFNAPTSTHFCFLLSTRAGGLGINLATADTVIIYDSDWNPHADLQAMARAHRLGQKGTVMIYRMVTRGSVEERMMQLTKKKLLLEHVVVGSMKTHKGPGLNQEELDDILRFGAKELFLEGDERRRIQYDDAAIEGLLDRSNVEAEEEGEENEYLRAFKVANFEYVAEEKEEGGLWEGLLKERYEESVSAALYSPMPEMGKGKRRRTQVNYTVEEEEEAVAGQEQEWEAMEEEGGEEEGMEEEEGEVEEGPRRVGGKRAPPALMGGEGRHLKVLGFSRLQRGAFYGTIMRFGVGEADTWEEFQSRIRFKSLQSIRDFGALFITHLLEPPTSLPVYSDGVPREGVAALEVLGRIALMDLVRKKVASCKGGERLFPAQPERRVGGWEEEHDLVLLEGVCRHGYGRWQDTVLDVSLGVKTLLHNRLNFPPQPTADSGEEVVVLRKMAEFVRKRVTLLGAAINQEYCTPTQGVMGSCGPLTSSLHADEADTHMG